MRVTSGSDWRDGIPFDTPVRLADVQEGEPTRCAACGPASVPVPREELWAVKHHHPKQHSGYIRFYCDAHVPRPAPVPVAAPAPARRAAPRASRPAAERTVAPRRPAQPERVRAVCPQCFVEVPPTGVCGTCGERVA